MAITVLQEKESQNISVYVRVRPLKPSINAADWEFNDTSISHSRNGCKKDYVLDNVFRDTSSTDQVYQQTTQPLVKTVLDGFSCTVFAYGQTNSGKTFTMRGTSSEDGIVGRAVTDLFEKLRQHQDRQFCLRASYMEIYNEEVNDLLNEEKQNLSIKMDQDNGIMVAGLSEVLVYSKQDVMRLLAAGDSKRHIGETKMNDKSSRSHSIFKMVVESTPMECEGNEENCNAIDSANFAVKIGVLNLVDLAGSERVTKTGAEGSRLKEGANINKSLLTLGQVIKNLSEGASQAGRHIPYRDSKLTRILQPSLGGNAKTVIICMMTPEAAHVDEGHNTLEFATRAKKVINEVAAVETMTSAALLKRQANEIEKLKSQLCQDGSENVAKEIQELQQKLLDMEKAMEIQAASIDIVTKEKTFFEKRNMDLMAANKRAAQKRSRMRRETIAHFGPVTDDGEDVASPCSGATRDSEMSIDAGFSDADADPTMTNGAQPSVLPAIGEDQEAPETTGTLVDDDQDGSSKKRCSRGSCGPSASASAGPRLYRASAGGSTGQRQRSQVTTEPFAEELRGCVRDLKAQLAERDSALTAAGEELAAVRAQVEKLDNEKETTQGELTKVQFALQRAQYERRSLQATEAQAAAENDAVRQQRDEALAHAAKLQESLQQYSSNLAAVMEERDADAQAAASRLREAEDARLAAERAVEKAEVDIKLHQERDRKRLEELEELAAEAAKEREEREVALRDAAQAGEGSARVAQELQDAKEEIERLKSHVSDLESRKRPPLYQRKQEEELKAASEHAAESEARMNAAEAALKATQEELAGATKDLAVLRAESERALARHSEQLEEWRVKHEYDLNEAKASAAKVESALQEEVEALDKKVQFFADTVTELDEAMSSEEAAAAAKIADLEAELQKHVADLQAERSTSREWEEALEHQNQKVAKLEEELAAHERDLEAVNTEIAAVRAAASQDKEEVLATHAAVLAAAAAAHETSMLELSSALTTAKEAHATELAALKEETLSTQQATEEEHAQALADKAAALESLGSHAHKLQEKLDEAPAAFKALAELKELRVKYKQDVASLNSQLKVATMSSKGGDKAKQLLQREFEKLQKKQSETDAKLRAAAVEKQQLASDKATMERKIKQLEMQVAKASKDVDKKEQAALKKLEASQEVLAKAREDLGKVEAKYAKARDENVKGTAVAGMLESRVATLEEQGEESQRLLKERERQLQTAREETTAIVADHDKQRKKWEEAAAKSMAEVARLTAGVSAAEARAGELTAQLDASRTYGAELSTQAEDLAVRKRELEHALQAAQDSASTEAALRAEAEKALSEARTSLEDWRAKAEALQRALDSEHDAAVAAARGHAATAADLQEQLRARAGEVTDLKAAAAAMADSLAAREDELATAVAERDAAQDEAKEAHTRAEDAGAELETIQERLADATQALAERKAELQANAKVMAVRDSELRKLRQELAQMKGQTTAMQGSHAEQVRAADEARTVAVAQLREARDELHAAKKTAADDSAAAKEAAAALRDAQAAAARTEAAREHLSAEVTQLGDQVQTLSADLQSLRAQLAEARSVEVGLRSREELSRREVALANEAVEEHVRTNETLQEELGRSEAELRRTKAELEMMQLTTRRSVAGTSLQDTTAATATDEEVHMLRVNVAELKAQLAEAHEQRGAIVANLQRAEADAQQQAATAAAMREAAEMYEDAQARVQELEDFSEYTEKAMADMQEANLAQRKELKEAQEKVEKANHDLVLWKDTYLMQKQLSRKLECIQDRMRQLLSKEHGVPESQFTKLADWLAEEYDRLYVRRQQKKKEKAEAAAKGQPT